MESSPLLKAILLLAYALAPSRAQEEPLQVALRWDAAQTHGDESLFEPGAGSVRVVWDSSRTNSYLSVPLGLTLTRADRFELSFEITLADVAIGTNPDKPYTFEIAVGLINRTNAFDPEMYRGSGINTAHGARNAVEWSYFPDSGFGATVAPTVVTEANQIAFSDNHPIALEPGVPYTFVMSFTSADQTLRSSMSTGAEPATPLKDLVLSSAFADFHLDALAICNYSDAGQIAPFAGSLKAIGEVRDLQVTIYDRPTLRWHNGSSPRLGFWGKPGYRYFLETSPDLQSWASAGEPLEGSDQEILVPAEWLPKKAVFFRVRRESLQ